MGKTKQKKTKQQKWWRFLKFQIVLILLVIAAVTYYYVAGYANKVAAMKNEAISFVSKSTEQTFREIQTSVVYDVNGDIISTLKGEKDVYYVKYKDIPAYLIQAAISIEDKRFYNHKGVDYRAIARAVVAMLRNGEVTEGASTITQQLARNVFLTQEKTWERKIEEIYIASELEKKYTKSQIMEFYLNNINFGNGYYGIEAAAKGYFNKDIAQLSLSEMCFLVAIPNNPTHYDPLLHFDATMERRDKILRNMLEDRVISEDTYNSAMVEPVLLNQPKEVEKKNYAETYTYYCATRALMEAEGFEFRTEFKSDNDEKQYSKAYNDAYEACNKQLFTGGYRIYTSLNLKMQNALQNSIDRTLSSYTETNDEGVYTLQSAAVCIDNTTGMVRAIIGGRSQDLPGYTLNRAFQSYRQPGSSIKPLLVYAPAIESGYTPDTIVNDTKIPDGPANSDGKYLGEITLRRAVELSRNTIAHQVLEELTPAKGLQYLKAMNFSRVSLKQDDNIAIALGGFTYGVSPLEMAVGYGTLENDGGYREPNCISKISDAQGNVIYQNEAETLVVYDQKAARTMTDILQGVFTEGTARGLGLGDMPCAGKTGTTNDNKDGWFVGYTRYYTTSVWVGYDMPREMKGLYGATYPGKIWQSFMSTVHKNLLPVEFPSPLEFEQEEGLPEENPGEEILDENGEVVEAQGEDVLNSDEQNRVEQIDENNMEE